MKKYISILLLLFIVIGLNKANAAGGSFRPKPKQETKMSEKDLPDSLKDWSNWATDGYRKNNCHYRFDNAGEKFCYYISELDLNINKNAMSFTEKVSLMDDGYVRLPGSVSLFPYSVKINDKEIPVVNIDSFPYLFLEKGEHTIVGEAKTVGNIRTLNIPNDVAILNIKKDGKTLDFVDNDGNGLLRLDSKTAQKTETDAIDVLAFRKIEDTIPMKMTLSMDLNVSGKDRLETFKNIIPENFAIVNISSNIPAYVQKNSDLVAEVKSGRWNITIEFRQLKESLEFSTRNLVNDNEIWVFVGNQDRRIIQMPESMVSIQTKNTLLPEHWKIYPAYSIDRNSKIKLNAVSYNTPQEDIVDLVRNIKLSFDGKFYSINDSLRASLRNDGRMYLEKPFILSSISIDGVPQAITKIKGENINGFEIRRGNYNIATNSRIARNGDKIAASGYNTITNNVIWNLDLAPGYSLFYINGADYVSNSWVSNWNLLNIFMVILLTVFFYYLFDIKKAVLGAILVLLLHHLLPQFTMACFILCGNVLIERYVASGTLISKINSYVKYTLLSLMSLTLVSFMIIHIRWAIYPSLARPDIDEYFANFLGFGFLLNFYIVSAIIFFLSSIFDKEKERTVAKVIKVVGVIYLVIYAVNIFTTNKTYYRERYTFERRFMETDSAELAMVNEDHMIERGRMIKKESKLASNSLASGVKMQMNGGIQYQNQNVAKNKIQTGLGFPNWSGLSTIRVELKGPINSLDKFNIFLISPFMNVILAFARLLLAIYVIYFISNINVDAAKYKFDTIKRAFYTILLMVLVGLNIPSNLNAKELINTTKSEATPSQEMIQQLRQKLTKETVPTCIPFCISIPNGSIANVDNKVTLNLSIHAADSIVIPLPMLQANNSNGVEVTSIKNNGKDAKNVIKKYGAIFLQLQEGVNNIAMEMTLNDSSNKFFLSSITPINYLKNNLKGFKLDGDSNRNQSFQITRIVNDDKKIKSNFSKNPMLSKINIETFFTINRFINLGNTWQITTIVVRNNNIDENATVDVPLLANEKVINTDGKLSNNSLLLSFTPNETRKEFTSIIPTEGVINLNYTDGIVNYNEVWSLNVDFMWNFKTEGLKPIASDDQQLLFYPSSGDNLKIFVSQPEGVDGNIITFKKVDYKFKPGRTMQELKVSLLAESSESSFHKILIPSGSEVKNLRINGDNYPIMLNQNDLVLPINQGITNIDLTINLNKNISNVLKFPAINLKAPAVDITEEAYVPVSRWILFTNGPLTGPSVLFWTQIPIWLCVAYILSRFVFIPLSFVQWFILLFGLSQTNILFTAIIISWFVVISLKNYLIDNFGYKRLVYGCVIAISLLFLYSLFEGVSNGLLGTWNMKIIGNNSQLIYENGNQLWKLIWYQDLSNGELPQAKIISLSIWIYRAMMVVWSIWLSFSLVRWIKWALMSLKDENRGSL